MSSLAGALVVIAVLGFIALMVYWSGKGEYRKRQMLFETQKQILDKLGTGPEVKQFIESEEGKEFFECLNPSPLPKKDTSDESLGHISFFTFLGFVAVGLGVGVLIASSFVPGYLLHGFVLMGGGIGCLVSCWIGYSLAVKWGYIRKYTANKSDS